MEMSCWFYKEILCFGANLAQGPAEHDKIILQMGQFHRTLTLYHRHAVFLTMLGGSWGHTGPKK